MNQMTDCSSSEKIKIKYVNSYSGGKIERKSFKQTFLDDGNMMVYYFIMLLYICLIFSFNKTLKKKTLYLRLV